jgi:predicted TIM-barrel fold metal-dependent hydrolase
MKQATNVLGVLCCLLLAAGAAPTAAQNRLPIIDMHMHAGRTDGLGPPPTGLCTPVDPPAPLWDQRRPFVEVWAPLFKSPPCADPVWSPITDDELRDETIEAMERLNVFGIISGMGLARDDAVIDAWLAAAPERFLAGARCVPPLPDCSVEVIRELHSDGRLEVLGELVPHMIGMAPDDERLEPYWTLAEELDIPVGIHLGIVPPLLYVGFPEERARRHSALTLEEVLVRHPRLRVYVMHAGYPMLDDMLAVLHAHPQVYVDTAAIVWHIPRAGFYRHLRGLVDAGHGKRVMFGSDNLQYPGLIERSIAVIEEAPFLTEEQKRDILYKNAARFLRLSDEEIARHHRM